MKMNKFFILWFAAVIILSGCKKNQVENQTYYVNSISGNDSNDGLSPETAWKSLKQAGSVQYTPGDKLLLCEGCTFSGKLNLKAEGTEENPVVVSSYSANNSEKSQPIIDAKGYTSAIWIENGKHIKIQNLELTADAGTPVEPGAKTVRYGVYIEANKPGDYPDITLQGLNIHEIFASENVEKDGQNPTSNMGFGIFVQMKNGNAKISYIRIKDCNIERTGHTGIRIFGDRASGTYLDSVTIVNNKLKYIGGPGMVPGVCENVLVRGNVVNYSGSDIDPRMHNRGSGIWPWSCKNVLIEKNKFMNAWGKMDSCGAHIDFNCSNVVVQYNLSYNNAGGFVEILGNDKNCCYRYNISINDGYRQQGVHSARHDGKILWTSGYVGKNPRTGPFNSYIYNNTIYVKPEYTSKFSFAPTTDGILIANNIFYLMGETVDVKDNERPKDESNSIPNVVFKNNLYQKTGLIPESVVIKDSDPLIGNPQFKNPGGTSPEDYIPTNTDLIKDKGITIEKIPNDDIGLTIGLKVEKDFFGNPVTGKPDLGAVEL